MYTRMNICYSIMSCIVDADQSMVFEIIAGRRCKNNYCIFTKVTDINIMYLLANKEL